MKKWNKRSILILGLVIGLVACGGKSDSNTGAGQTTQADTTTTPKTQGKYGDGHCTAFDMAADDRRNYGMDCAFNGDGVCPLDTAQKAKDNDCLKGGDNGGDNGDGSGGGPDGSGGADGACAYTLVITCSDNTKTAVVFGDGYCSSRELNWDAVSSDLLELADNSPEDIALWKQYARYDIDQGCPKGSD